jgi:hypothetical protein
LDVDLAGDHLVPEVRDDRRDEREPILALGGGQHPEMLDTRYLRLSKRPPTAACVSLGVPWVSALPQNLGERDFPAPTLGRCMGVTTSIGPRHNHQR